MIGQPLIYALLVELVLAGGQPPQHLIHLILPQAHAACVSPAGQGIVTKDLTWAKMHCGGRASSKHAINNNRPLWLKSISQGNCVSDEGCDCLYCTDLLLLYMYVKSRGLPNNVAALQVGRSRHFVWVCGEAADQCSVKPRRLLRHVRACSLLCLQPAFCW